MSNIRVSYGEMESAGSQLSAVKDEIAAKLHFAEGQISSLVSSGFVTDQASPRFNAAFGEFLTSATTVIEKLSEMHRFLSQSAEAMRELDTQIAARIGL